MHFSPLTDQGIWGFGDACPTCSLLTSLPLPPLQPPPLSPPGAAGVERAGCSVGPGAGPGGAVPPSPRLGPRPSALGCLHHRLRPQDGLRNFSTENDKLGTSAPVTLRRLRCFYTVPDSGTSSQRSIRQHDGFSGGRE